MPIFQCLQLTIFFHIFVATRTIRSLDHNILEPTDLAPQHIPESDCTTEESVLKAVLVKLGLETQDLHQPGIITWDGCHVTSIDLRNRKDLEGSLSSDIGKLRKLKLLDLTNTKVSGDLSSLKGTTKLQGLWLDGTEVSGDLSSLKGATGLQLLYLGGTKVSGDLSSLKDATWLQWLSLKATEVSGDLSSLKEATELKKIDLLRTFVTGDFSVLLQWPEVEEVDFSGTNISGELSEEWRGKAKKLLRLRLADAGPQFERVILVLGPRCEDICIIQCHNMSLPLAHSIDYGFINLII